MEIANQVEAGQGDDGLSENTILTPPGPSLHGARRHQSIIHTTSSPGPPASLAPEADEISSSFPTILQAELVTPPVEAYRVAIDDEDDHRTEARSSSEPKNEEIGPCRFSVACMLVVSCLVIVLLCIIVGAVIAIVGPPSSSSTSSSSSGELDPMYPYPCFNSTKDIVLAQISQEKDGQLSEETFIICPNTWINVGRARNPASNDFTVVDGDYPIMAVRENVTIQCGLDGRRENNCTLDGGSFQLLTIMTVPMPDGEWVYIDTPTDNMTIRGLTFTGKLNSQGHFGGGSVLLAHPGRGMLFEDCAWTDLAVMQNLIALLRTDYQVQLDLPLDDYSVEVTFSECSFTNITYEDPLILALAQTVVVERSVFDNIKLSKLGSWCEREGSVFYFPEIFCSGLLYCGPASICALRDVCVSTFERPSETPSIVYVSNTSSFYHENLFLDETPASFVDCQMSIVGQNASTDVVNCSRIFISPECPVQAT
jgi:hypothetical protein